MADDDDLDAFFDEVDEVVEEVKKEEKEEIIDSTSTLSKDGDEDDVDRPSKRIRTSDEDTAPVIKKAAVVVSKAATTISAPPVHHNNNNIDGNGNGIYQITVPESSLQQQAPPPPPPPTQQQFAATYQMHNQSTKPVVRVAAGKKWVDNTLSNFPENDFRLFVGNLDAVVTEQKLAEAFQSKYPSFAMCRIIYDKNSGESKGYGFVSVMDPKDCAKAIREMDGSWLASRPIKVKRSDWKERDLKHVRKSKKGRRR
ncbi:hypothetical protein CTEN210_17358 [Chaetoceros tenuissimus]|uniref:RRM domain-containing protein n=1 Tax=Chaetoceros tenuissimus TaxID=426638 RepID=A0AAD3DAD8_9STRA|nr:hypothetical protein CTEN210_17358 [Chaetoceros tenuissimus]